MQPKKYTRESLIKSERFVNYQKDFLEVILNKDMYTLAEADKTVKAFFNERRQ